MITIHMTDEQAKLVLRSLGSTLVERTQRAAECRKESPVLANWFDSEAAAIATIYVTLSSETRKEA